MKSGEYTKNGQNIGARNRFWLKFQDVTNGTVNTILVVEAKRDIPWSKPEDIKYDGKNIPKFGGFHHGGFNAATCDGAVRFISEDLDKIILQNLLNIRDGNPIRK